MNGGFPSCNDVVRGFCGAGVLVGRETCLGFYIHVQSFLVVVCMFDFPLGKWTVGGEVIKKGGRGG